MRNSKGYKALEVLGGSGFKDFLLSVFSVGMICFRIIPTENDAASVKSILLHRERILHAKVNSCRRIFSSRSCSWKTNRCLTNCFHISSIKKIRQHPPLLYRLVQKSSPKALKLFSMDLFQKPLIRTKTKYRYFTQHEVSVFRFRSMYQIDFAKHKIYNNYERIARTKL